MLRTLSRSASVLALSAGLLVATPAAPLSFGGLRNSLIEFALDQISVEGAFEIRAESIEQPEDGVTELVGVTISDGDGVWLRAEAFSLRWNARALLSGELDIERLATRGLRVERRPNLPEVEVKEDAAIAQGEPRGLFDWPRAPLTVQLRELALERTFLAAGVLAEDRSIGFDAVGSARDAGDEQAAELVLTRTDAVAGEIRLDYLRDFAAGTLGLRLTAEEAPRGIAAAFLGLPDDAAARVSLDAGGPLSDWQATLSAEAEQMLTVAGRARLDARAALDAELALTLRPGPALAPDIAAAMGDEAQLDLKVRENDQGVINVERGSLRSPALNAGASGLYDKTAGTVDFDVALTANAPLAEAVPGVDFTALGFTGAVDGTVADLTAKGALSVDGLRTAPVDLGRARLDVDVRVAGQDISGAVRGDAGGLRLDQLSPELLGATTLDIAGAWAGAEQRATLERARLSSPLLDVFASGTADVGADAAALSWRVSTPDLSPVAAAYGQDAAGRLTAEGRMSGALSAPRLEGQLSAEALRVGPERLGSVRARHDVTLGETIGGVLDVTSRGGRFGPAEVSTRFEMAGETLTLSELNAAALGATLGGAATVDLAGPLVSGSLALDAPRLENLGPVFTAFDLGAPPSGALSGDLGLSHAGGVQNAALDLSGLRLSAMGYGAGRVAFTGRAFDVMGDPRAEGVLDVARASGPDGLSLAAARFDGKARDLAGAVEADGVLTASGLRGPGGIGAASLRLDGTGRNLAASPDAEAKLVIEGVDGPDGIAAGEIALDASLRDLFGAGLVDGTLRAAALSGPGGVAVAALSADGSARDVTGDPGVRATVKAEGLRAGDARVRALSAEADLSGLASAPRGTATARATTISAGGAAIPSATLKADLTGPAGGRTDVSATLSAPGATAVDARLGAIRVRADVRDALGAPVIAARAGIEGGEAMGATLKPLSFTADGPLGALKLALDAAATLRDGREATLEAAAQVDADGPLAARVSTLEANVSKGSGRAPEPAIRVALEAPLVVSTQGSKTRLRGLDLALPGGRLTGDLGLGAGLSGALRLAMEDLAPAARITGAPIESGALDVSAEFNTAAGRAKVDASGRGLRLDGADPEGAPMALTASADWSRGRLSAEAEATGNFGEPLRATAALPLRPNGMTPYVPRGAQIDASLRWRGEIAPLWALVPAPDHLLSGEAFVDLTLSGPIASPQPSGELRLSGGRYENLETGTILADLSADTGLAEDGAMTLDVSAHDGSRNPVTVTARIAGGEVDAKVEASSAVLVRRDDASAAVSIDVTAAGPLAAPLIAGTVGIDRAEIRLVNATPPSVADLGEIEWKGDPPREEGNGASGAGPQLDLAIKAPDDIFVRGRGLVSEWKADLAVTGPAAAPRIRGVVEKIRGELRLLSRPFTLERGRITFDGGAEIDPGLDIAMELERDDVIGRIAVRGTGSEPEIVLESRPPLPEEEVLPRILFGQSRQSLTAGQAAELASAAATLASGDEGMLGALRESAGLDTLAVGTDGVEIGTSLVDGVYVGAKQPVDGGKAEVTVEIEIFDNLSVEGATGGENPPSVGLDWKMDF
ncbi:translocation/assembly module TamB domain-containing protein [Rhodovulum sp. DZ06]|uniref:translocation/assembly module TamB domain-containing protein n=1 Tax=Rhodovulum sp. DZ06 TaxID=3425126 RepID=UPI003D333CFF